MELYQSIIYGIVQGLTEFLPVSSTAHLRIVPALLNWSDPGSAFTAVIQLGTVVAVLIYFWSDLSKAFIAFFRSLFGHGRDTVEAKTGWAVFYATLPMVILGLALKDFIEGPFRSLYVISAGLILMGITMWVVERKFQGNRDLSSVAPVDGIKVGLWQCLSLIPGMSRSGSSITGAFFAGFDKASATRLSFLMSVPAITLAGFYEGIKEIKLVTGEMMLPTMVATFVSFIVGYGCIKWLISFVQRRGLTPFVAYRVGLGVLILVLCWSGKLNPTDSASFSSETKVSTNQSSSER